MFLMAMMVSLLVACAGDGGSKNPSDASQNQETTKENAQEEKVYKIGDTWEVEGLWKLTINSVKEVNERNEFSDKKPEAVYIVDYTYENIGYKDSVSDGLYMSPGMEQIVDSQNEMGYEYPGDISKYPDKVPVGASCTAEVCIGVNHAGSFKVLYSEYGTDEDLTKYTATFEVDVK
ncbi:hypothetical protein P261_01642 [Lachnospiraceae bacterium TWA4]|nr:hypothetical protein P261_01642 [Lachnospiraceae bacterium TWA4]